MFGCPQEEEAPVSPVKHFFFNFHYFYLILIFQRDTSMKLIALLLNRVVKFSGLFQFRKMPRLLTITLSRYFF